jgi:hypothetical protein
MTDNNDGPFYSVLNGKQAPIAFTNVSADSGFSVSGADTGTLSFTFDPATAGTTAVRNLNFTVTSSSGDDAKITIPSFGGNAWFSGELYKLSGTTPANWIYNEENGQSYTGIPRYSASVIDSSLTDTPNGNNTTVPRSIARLSPGSYTLRLTFGTNLGSIGRIGGVNVATISGSMILSPVGNKTWSGDASMGNSIGFNAAWAGIGTDTLVGTGLPNTSAIRQFALDTRYATRANRENLNAWSSLQIGSGSKTLTFNRISGTQSDIWLILNSGNYSANGWAQDEDMGYWTTTNLSSATSITLQSATTAIFVLRAVGPTSGTNAQRIHTIEFILS